MELFQIRAIGPQSRLVPSSILLFLEAVRGRDPRKGADNA